MKKSYIPPHPLLSPVLIEQLKISPSVTFVSSRGNPGARGEWGEQFTLGHDSDWNPAQDELEVLCQINSKQNVQVLFGPEGVAPRSATLCLALEWFSSDSGWRLMGAPVMLSFPEVNNVSDNIQLCLTLPPNTVRGTGMLSLQLLLGDAGVPEEDEKGLARTPGFRFGTLGSETRLIIDGDGSLFPVLEEELGADDPLWRFSQDWSDPTEDEFSIAWVSLSLNTKHPDFPLLRSQGSNMWTPLFCQVMASWITVFIIELKAEPGVDFSEIALGRPTSAVRGSIVDAAASMIRRGELNCSSPGELIRSVLAWIDTAARTS